MSNNNVTRGDGLLEGFLAKKRAGMANSLIDNKLRKGKILDIGCGSYPHFLISTTFNKKYGIDPSVTEQKFKGIEIRKNNVEKDKLPFENNYFDAVVMLAVFEHINNEKLEFVLREVVRVMKKDSVFIITTPAPWSDKLLHVMARTGLISKEEIHDHKHNHPHQEIKKFLTRIGFKKKEIESGYFELGMNMWFKAKK